MSYSGYNQLSPYWQSPTTQQEGKNHFSHGSNGSRHSDSHPPNSYQPLSAYQSQYDRQQPQSQHHQTNAHLPSYGSISASQGGQRHDSAAYASSRPDTTALGNLAYASSLGQDQQHPSLSQIIDYNRAQGMTNYEDRNVHDDKALPLLDYDHYRPSTHEPPNVETQRFSQAQPGSTTFQTPNGHSDYQGYKQTMDDSGRNSPAQKQPAASQAVQQATQAQLINRYAQLPPPIGGQVVQRPNSKTNVQSNQSIRGPAVQPPPSTSFEHNARHSPSAGKTSVATSGMQYSAPLPAPANQSRTNNKTPTQVLAKGEYNRPGRKGTIAPPAPPSSHETEDLVSRSAGTEERHPTTVDPNQVFNHYEYQRRQNKAEAARKASVEVKVSPTATKSTSTSAAGHLSPVAPSDDVTQAAKAVLGASTGANQNADSATKEQIELEMKQMIEKMRDYKAKDPTLFSQVWEQVKKGQPPQRMLSQAPAQGSVQTKNVDGQTINATSVDLPAESDLPAATSFLPDFDRGKYPMQRRRRGNKLYTPERPASHGKKSAGTINGQQFIKASAGGGTGPPASDTLPAIRNTVNTAGQPKHTSASPAPQNVSRTKSSAANAKRPPPAGTTYWPEHKKRVLADAARNALTSDPLNVGKSITSDEIHGLLDQNPSYQHMCELLETKGFVIDRGQFARLLLAAVPDEHANTSLPTANRIKPQPSPSHRPTPQSPSIPKPLPYQAQIHHMTPATPSLSGSHVVATGRDSGLGHPASWASKGTVRQGGDAVTSEPSSGTGIAQSKQDKAKKRSFGDIVDLSAISDEEDLIRHRPKPRTEVMVSGAMDQKYPGNPYFKTFNHVQQPAVPNGPIGQLNVGQSKPRRSGREHLLFEMVVEPMDKRRDALRRSSYDPRTICRDILLASGRHPTLAPLNSHLDGLREKFVSVENSADLSTFRWDLVDPGGPPRPSPIATKPKITDGPDMGVGIEKNMSFDHPRTAVQAGAHGASRSRPDFAAQPTNSNPGPRRKGRPPKMNRHVNRLSNVANQPSSSPQRHPSQEPLRIDEIRPDAANPPGTPYQSTNSPASRNPASSVSTPLSAEVLVRIPGRRGRPPGAKNKQVRPDKGVAKKSKMPQEPLQSPATPSIPRRISHDASTPARPSGLRNAMTPPSGIAVVVPSRSPSITAPTSAWKGTGMIGQDDRSGRPPSEPSYKVYKCHWEHCPAELHNLSILRKHVRKQHRERLGNGPWLCKWADCIDHSPRRISNQGKGNGSGNEDGEHHRLSFHDGKAWDTHVETNHLSVYAAASGNGTMVYSPDVRTLDEQQLILGRQREASRVQPSPGHTQTTLHSKANPKIASGHQEAHIIQDSLQGGDAHANASTSAKAQAGMGIFSTGWKFVTDSKRMILGKGGSTSADDLEEIDGGDNGIGGLGSLDEPSSSGSDSDSTIAAVGR